MATVEDTGESSYRNAKLRFPVDADMALGLGAQYALAGIVEALKAETDAVARLPGFRFALAQVENHYITQVQSNTLATAKLAARNGVDLDTHQLATVRAEMVAVPIELAERSA
jgi:hypothetical protein